MNDARAATQKQTRDAERASIEKMMRRLSSLEIGQRAALRRCVGKNLEEADGRALEAFYLSAPPPGRREISFAVACWSCLWLRPQQDAAQDVGSEAVGMSRPDFAACLRRARDADGGTGWNARMRALLDTALQEGLGLVKIGRLMRRLHKMNVQPDFAGLLEDLRHWDSPTRYVQRKWADVYFGYGVFGAQGEGAPPNPDAIALDERTDEM